MNFTYDTAFAHAVRRSVNSIKLSISKAGEQGKRLAEILRDESSDLDEHGWELFRQAVTGGLRKPYGKKQVVGESDFAQAVRQSFKGTRAHDGKDRAVEGVDLAGMLGNQLGMGERELLAQMVTRTGPTFWLDGTEYDGVDLDGAPSKGTGHPKVQMCISILNSKLNAGEVHKNAVLDTAHELRISPRTVENYERLTREARGADVDTIGSYHPRKSRTNSGENN